jgi:hypothetical protein
VAPMGIDAGSDRGFLGWWDDPNFRKGATEGCRENFVFKK